MLERHGQSNPRNSQRIKIRGPLAGEISPPPTCERLVQWLLRPNMDAESGWEPRRGAFSIPNALHEEEVNQ